LSSASLFAFSSLSWEATAAGCSTPRESDAEQALERRLKRTVKARVAERRYWKIADLTGQMPLAREDGKAARRWILEPTNS
jgi:hypothetical protein